MGVPAGVNGQKPSGVLVRVEAGPESAKKKSRLNKAGVVRINCAMQ